MEMEAINDRFTEAQLEEAIIELFKNEGYEYENKYFYAFFNYCFLVHSVLLFQNIVRICVIHVWVIFPIR